MMQTRFDVSFFDFQGATSKQSERTPDSPNHHGGRALPSLSPIIYRVVKSMGLLDWWLIQS